MAPSTYIGPPTRDVFYKASATDAELRSADAEYADVTDGPVAITLAVEYGARAPSATRCLLTWPVGAAQEGVRILRLLDDEGPARVRLHAATYARHDLVGDAARDAGAHWREWTLGMLDRAQRTLMERLAFLRPNRGIRSQRDWIEGLLNVFCLRGFFLRETVEHCTWFIRAWSQAPEQDLPASDGLLSIEDGEWDDDEGQPIYTADERSPSPMATSSGVSVDGVDSPMEPATPEFCPGATNYCSSAIPSYRVSFRQAYVHQSGNVATRRGASIMAFSIKPIKTLGIAGVSVGLYKGKMVTESAACVGPCDIDPVYLYKHC